MILHEGARKTQHEISSDFKLKFLWHCDSDVTDRVASIVLHPPTTMLASSGGSFQRMTQPYSVLQWKAAHNTQTFLYIGVHKLIRGRCDTVALSTQGEKFAYLWGCITARHPVTYRRWRYTRDTRKYLLFGLATYAVLTALGSSTLCFRPHARRWSRVYRLETLHCLLQDQIHDSSI